MCQLPGLASESSMSLFKPETLGADELARALACLPAAEHGLAFDEALALWRQWHAQGALNVGWVRAMGKPPPGDIECLGVRLWISDEGAAALLRGGAGSAAQRLYHACHAAWASGTADRWVMHAEQIGQAHAAQGLNLLVLHFGRVYCGCRAPRRAMTSNPSLCNPGRCFTPRIKVSGSSECCRKWRRRSAI